MIPAKFSASDTVLIAMISIFKAYQRVKIIKKKIVNTIAGVHHTVRA